MTLVQPTLDPSLVSTSALVQLPVTWHKQPIICCPKNDELMWVFSPAKVLLIFYEVQFVFVCMTLSYHLNVKENIGGVIHILHFVQFVLFKCHRLLICFVSCIECSDFKESYLFSFIGFFFFLLWNACIEFHDSDEEPDQNSDLVPSTLHCSP